MRLYIRDNPSKAAEIQRRGAAVVRDVNVMLGGDGDGGMRT